MRRSSGRGVLVLLAGMTLLWLPVAAAAMSSRSIQTLTIATLVSAVAGLSITWVALRPWRYVRTAQLAIGALIGALVSTLLLGSVEDATAAPRLQLGARVLVVALLDVVGLWLIAVAVRRIVRPRARGVLLAALVLVAISVFPGPSLLTAGRGAILGLSAAQVDALLVYWSAGSILLIAPFVALTTVPGDWFERWWEQAAATIMSISNRAFAIGLVAATAVLAAGFAVYCFDRRPTTADEIAQLWHGRILLTGRLSLPEDPNPEFFAVDNVIDRPRWLSQFPIGGPALLAMGHLVGTGWLVNPILTGLMALNVYRFAQRAYGEAQGRAAALVFATSPMILIMGASYMNHTATALLVTVALAMLPVWVGADNARTLRRAGGGIGVSIGAATMIRPLDGFVAGAVVGLLMLALVARERHRLASVLVAIGAGLVPITLLLVANWITMGSPLRFGYEVLWGANHSLGLHDDPSGNPHTPWRALLLGIKYATQLNWVGTAWPVPLLLIVAVALVVARQHRRWDTLLLALFFAQLAVYAFYWHDGQFVGPRFLFTAVPAVLILVARSPFMLAERTRGVWKRIALVTIPVCILITWARPMYPYGVRGMAREYRDSRAGMKRAVPVAGVPAGTHGALIFVREGVTSRIARRLWGLGISRPDAARLLREADGCSLLEALVAEERRSFADSAGTLKRIEAAVRPFDPEAPNNRFVPDPAMHFNNATVVTENCSTELALDLEIAVPIGFGPLLLHNQIDEEGHIGGRVIYAIDLGERNELLRPRFGDRTWYRYVVPRDRPNSAPVLIPYR